MNSAKIPATVFISQRLSWKLTMEKFGLSPEAKHSLRRGRSEGKGKGSTFLVELPAANSPSV
ncbi:MAG: hypothetical protein A3C06_02515 [Candidatus Taylorbacteria bacterium RIFCSPHIGHO2_02_FULL_46_13]|uniref:Uncharacterized protein n=1 Tax=Candidatus Taylorbacteria bacterium RIFCSPHIGHO2_02_FULL_46_13 TaxID=1802312 RepID=A0A1G2MTD0_9BACT|nr:MAG: hypothetical protein A3C06_02515 [Candidatus Taylorbacteria bacterium RIFCSPHIGHO2_02_FULL_46_13]